MTEEKRSRLFEISVTAIGIIVTAVLGYGQWRLGQQQNLILENQAKQVEKGDRFIFLLNINKH